MAEGNGDLATLLGRILDEKLQPIIRDLSEIRREISDMRGSLKRLNERLSTVEAFLGLDPYGPKH